MRQQCQNLKSQHKQQQSSRSQSWCVMRWEEVTGIQSQSVSLIETKKSKLKNARLNYAMLRNSKLRKREESKISEQGTFQTAVRELLKEKSVKVEACREKQWNRKHHHLQQPLEENPCLDADKKSVSHQRTPAESNVYLQSAEDAWVFHTLVCGELSEASTEDVEMPQYLRDKTQTHKNNSSNWINF